MNHKRQLAQRVAIGLTPLAWGPTSFFVGDQEGPGLMQLEEYEPSRLIPVAGQMAVHGARNWIVEKFLRDRSEPYLLFLDHDMMFPADLLTHVGGYREVAAYSGTYFLRDMDRPLPVAYMFRPERGDMRYAIREVYEWTEEQNRGLHRVDVVGAGCLAIHRDILAAMKRDWFMGVIGGEDVHFCRRCHELGYPVYLDTRIACRHLVQMGLGANWFRGWAQHAMRNVPLEIEKQILDPGEKNQNPQLA